MNNKGFTLIEILVVIVILAAVSVTVGVNMSGMQERQNQKELDEYNNTLLKAACLYVEIKDNSVDTITVEELINEGLVRKTLVNPKTKETVEKDKDKIIEIKWENNEKKCIFKE